MIRRLKITTSHLRMNKKLTKTLLANKVRINAKTEIPNKTIIAAIKEGKKTSRNRK